MTDHITSRRKFLSGGSAVAAAGAATLGFPTIVKAQGPITMKWQSTWPSKDIFHEYANDFAKKINDMTGGDLKIDVLPAGAVVPAFGLLEAVSKGTLDGGHGVLVYHVCAARWPITGREMGDGAEPYPDPVHDPVAGHHLCAWLAAGVDRDHRDLCADLPAVVEALRD